MPPAALLAKDEEDKATVVAHEALVTLPIEAVARLDRMATASLLATGLAHEIANPLTCLIAALDAHRGTRRADTAPPRRSVHRQRSGRAGVGPRAGLGERKRDLRSGARLPAVPAAARAGDVGTHLFQAADPARRPDGAGAAGRQEPGVGGAGEAPRCACRGTAITQIVLNLLLDAADAIADRPWNANLVEVRLSTRAALGGHRGEGQRPRHRRRDPQRLFEPGVTGKPGGRSLGPRAGDLPRAGPRGGRRDLPVVAALGSTLFRIALPPAGVEPRRFSGRGRSSTSARAPAARDRASPATRRKRRRAAARRRAATSRGKHFSA